MVSDPKWRGEYCSRDNYFSRFRLDVGHDGLANVYGEKSLEAYLRSTGMGEQWGEHMSARDELIYATDFWQSTWRRDMSYMPEDGS